MPIDKTVLDVAVYSKQPFWQKGERRHSLVPPVLMCKLGDGKLYQYTQATTEEQPDYDMSAYYCLGKGTLYSVNNVVQIVSDIPAYYYFWVKKDAYTTS
jgi:hypothetical protein